MAAGKRLVRCTVTDCKTHENTEVDLTEVRYQAMTLNLCPYHTIIAVSRGIDALPDGDIPIAFTDA